MPSEKKMLLVTRQATSASFTSWSLTAFQIVYAQTKRVIEETMFSKNSNDS
jgi:hypothetical protein